LFLSIFSPTSDSDHDVCQSFKVFGLATLVWGEKTKKLFTSELSPEISAQSCLAYSNYVANTVSFFELHHAPKRAFRRLPEHINYFLRKGQEAAKDATRDSAFAKVSKIERDSAFAKACAVLWRVGFNFVPMVGIGRTSVRI
jgi:hypothetical protein